MAFFEVDTGIVLRFTIFNAGQVLDLTTSQKQELLVEGNPNSPFLLTPVVGVKGVAIYTVKLGDFSASLPPKVSATVRVTFSPTQVIHTKTIQLDVKKLFN
jgi:hypothetical protein